MTTDHAIEYELTVDSGPRAGASRRYRSTLKIMKYLIITGCSLYLGYFIKQEVSRFLAHNTDVDVSVKFMREIDLILPGVTICSQSLTQLSKLKVAPDVYKIRSDPALNDSEKYLLSDEKIRKEIDNKVSSLTLKSYFEHSSGLLMSKELIEFTDCNLGFWRLPGKFSKASIPETCDNLFKVRLVDASAGMCFTLFHEAPLKALKENPRLGLDEFWKEDESIQEFIATGEMTPKVLYPENGLLRMVIDFNMRATDKQFNETFANESTDLRDAYGGKFWIHSNRVVPKLSMTGYTLRSGKQYTFYIKRTIFKLLPPPHATKCRNYTQEYLNAVKNSPPWTLSAAMSREACIDECIVIRSFKSRECKCWPTPVPYRRDNQTAKHEDSHFCEKIKGNDEACYSNFVPVCETECPPDCRQDFYEIIIKEKAFPDELEWHLIRDTKGKLYHEDNMDDIKREYDRLNPYHPPTIVDIVYASNEETYHIHFPELGIIDLIVNVAGLLGLFLSLSADVSIDFLEFLLEKFLKVNIPK